MTHKVDLAELGFVYVWFNSNFIFRLSKVKASKGHPRAFKVPIIEKTWVPSFVIFSRNSFGLRGPSIVKWSMWSSVLVLQSAKVIQNCVSHSK